MSVPGGVTPGPMYGHGFATLFLAEAYGMTRRPEIRDKLEKAVRLIIDTQNGEGGWRYQPRKADADLSVTICQINALRAAKNAGLFVPRETVEACIRYVKLSQNADGGFRYQLNRGGVSAFPRSAAGVVALQSAGEYRSREIDQGIAYLNLFTPGQGFAARDRYFFYGQYYAIQAMWLRGGDDWGRWFPAIRDELLSRQNTEGSWSDDYGGEYGTSMALIILQVPNGYLPIFQR
ncbi:MAG: prenyltransferase/squalene oxidase repeat-containing protein [Isosphaeraceae bacterium]